MALTDALGNLIDFRLLPGQAHDLRGTAASVRGRHLSGSRQGGGASMLPWADAQAMQMRLDEIEPPRRLERPMRFPC